MKQKKKKKAPKQFKKTIELKEKSQASSIKESGSVQFRDLGLHPIICQACERIGYQQPTEVQQKAIPFAIQGKDVIGVSKTGTGKTACFILPVLHSFLVQKTKVSPCSALVVAPNRELCLQIEEHFKMIGEKIQLRTACLIGGMESKLQEVEIQKGPHIVVGTPGRIVYFLENCKQFNLFRCQFLCIDECDMMLGVKFKSDVETILKYFKKVSNVRKIIVSATMTKKIWKLQKLYLSKNVEFVDCSHGRYSTVEALTQKYLLIPEKYKEVYLCYVLNELSGKRVMVFVSQNADSLRLTIILRAVGFPAVPLTSVMTEENRLSCLKKFQAGDYPILVSTDLSSRGLDIKNVDVVINYDVPINSKDYIHRIGRTARMEREGLALTFVTQYDIEYFQRIEKLISKKMEEFKTNKSDAMVLVNTVYKAKKVAKSRMDFNETQNDTAEDVMIDKAITTLKRKREKGANKRRKRRKKK